MRRSVAALALAVVVPTGAFVAPAAFADVVVKPGETLSEIAERHGISLNRLMQANGIKDPTLLQAGQRLVIPGSSRAAAAAPAPRGGGSVTVRSGETLSEIAERQGVSLERLMQANGIKDPTLLQAGQRLVIPGAQRAAAAPAAPAGPTGFYTVQSGETLSEIAARNGTSVERLMQLNRISNANLVVAGTRLSVPMRPRPAAAKPSAPRNARFHVVQSGETLSHIAADYNVPVERLISLNRISDPNMVVAGTRLQLQSAPPVAKPKPRPQTVASKPKPKPKPSAPSVARQPAAAQTPAATAQAPAASQTPVATAKPATSTEATAAAVAPTETASATPKAASSAAPTTKAETTAAATSSANSKPASSKPATSQPANSKPASSQPVASKSTTTTTTTPAQTKPQSQTQTAAKPRPAATASKPAAVARKPVGSDWRTYGPMQVDWANWKAMGGSFVAPTLGSDGKPHYLAINCGARKLNATSQSGQWRTWDSPQNDYEQRLVSDLCTSKGT